MNKAEQSKKSLIVAVLMVKNESSSIEETLSFLSKGGIRHFSILDTGSSDNTLKLVHSFFRERDLDGYVIQEPFIDFATSRNRALELAEQQFPNIPFLLMPDAEWHLYNAEELINFCAKEQYSETPLYLIEIKMNATEFSVARLFRTANQVRFEGVVHEVPNVIASVKVPNCAYFKVQASAQGIEKSRTRWQQDLILLSKAYESDPNNPRHLFYLAQTYECLSDFKKAYQFYQYRAELNGWDEENFITLLRLGNIAQYIASENPVLNWALAMEYFLKAFSLRPHRIEPLVKIAEHYWPNNIQACYLFIRQAYDTPYPQHDLLFINKEDYQYRRYEIMSRCAWYVEEYSLGEQATRLALKIHPEEEHLHKNLKLYQAKLELKTA